MTFMLSIEVRPLSQLTDSIHPLHLAHLLKNKQPLFSHLSSRERKLKKGFFKVLPHLCLTTSHWIAQVSCEIYQSQSLTCFSARKWGDTVNSMTLYNSTKYTTIH